MFQKSVIIFTCCLAFLAISNAVPVAKPSEAVLASAPVVSPLVGPAVVTAHSSQVIARNYNGVAAPLIAAPAVAAYSAPIAAPLAAAPVAAAPLAAAPVAAAPYVSPYYASPYAAYPSPFSPYVSPYAAYVAP